MDSGFQVVNISGFQHSITQAYQKTQTKIGTLTLPEATAASDISEDDSTLTRWAITDTKQDRMPLEFRRLLIEDMRTNLV